MADIEYTYGVYGEDLYADEYDPQEGAEPVPAQTTGRSFGRIVNIAGAVASLTLVVGVGIWGYKLMVRDVSGVPVVRALEGPMRVAPDDPGGQPADHMGLAVNAVAAGTSADDDLPDTLTLAPRPVHLTDEDTPMEGGNGAVVTAKSGAAVKIRDGAIDNVVQQIAGGPGSLDKIAEEGVDTQVDTVTMGEESSDDLVGAHLASVDPALLLAPGVKVSPRPMERPVRMAAAARVDVADALKSAQDVMATSTTVEVDSASLSAGTRLAQLGAYDSPDIAREEWDKLYGRFGDYMSGKKRVIQKASSGGRTFYRLRAMGFDDLSDARRFCSALVAENADCIPVTVR